MNPLHARIHNNECSYEAGGGLACCASIPNTSPFEISNGSRRGSALLFTPVPFADIAVYLACALRLHLTAYRHVMKPNTRGAGDRPNQLITVPLSFSTHSLCLSQ